MPSAFYGRLMLRTKLQSISSSGRRVLSRSAASPFGSGSLFTPTGMNRAENRQLWISQASARAMMSFWMSEVPS